MKRNKDQEEINMEFKGTKSEENLKAALAGESLARNKYTYYALQAIIEGHDDIAEFFEKMANNEKEHAKIWFKMLYGGLGETSANLRDAASSENYEWKSMYPGFAADARADGLEMLAAMFEKVAAIENDHERSFLEKFLQFKTGSSVETHLNIPNKSSASERPVSHVEETSNVTASGTEKYRCMFCGNLEETRLDVCPVCGAIGAFERVK